MCRLAARFPCAHARQHWGIRSKTRGAVVARAGETDVQVFRFTLGIPGFDDTYIPRVVGGVGASLVAANHLLSEGTSTAGPAQTRAECIGIVLALLLVALPALEAALLKASGTQGRLAASATVPGAVPFFVFSQALPEDAKKALAWASFTCMKNLNVCTLLAVSNGELVLGRGAIADSLSSGGTVELGVAGDALLRDLEGWAALGDLLGEGRYLETPQSMRAEGVAGWTCVPKGVKSVFVAPLNSRGVSCLVAFSEFEGGLGTKDLVWLRSVRDKLRQELSMV